ncbi:DUF3383 family protein [Paramixta manurensis]|uniref:DUF3383 family protein n=1 Tax=Paramixta manurensis TaxID=2740817 RepID=A0A6M8UN10_9GAMM|nr:DUF3383 family protein [Erwiniaceae bacterium PD-1]
MSSLNQIASVDINLNTATVGKANFGIPLVVSPTTAFGERVRRYSSYSSAVSDQLDSHTLSALQAVFSQTPRPKQAYVGRRDAATIVVVPKDSSPIEGEIYSFTVNGTEISYTAMKDDTLDLVATGLSEAMGSEVEITDFFNAPTVSEGKVTLTVKNHPESTLTLFGKDNVSIQSIGATDNLASDMDKIKAEDNTWYGWSLVELNDDLITQGASWTETQNKLFFARSNTASIWSADSDDLASQLMGKQYLRTVLIADKFAATQYPDAAVMGRFFTKDPGEAVFALKSLVTIADSKFTDTEKANIIKKNANTYEQYSDGIYLFGVGTEQKPSGRVVSGEWIDVVRDRDWLTDDIQTSLASVKVRNGKIPYTNVGIALIINTLRARLANAQIQGVIAPDEKNSAGETVPGFKIDYPNAADIDADTKASRILYISFIGLLSGAVQLTQIDGTLSYDYQ